jgi:methyl-accepting chemotaxis protein
MSLPSIERKTVFLILISVVAIISIGVMGTLQYHSMSSYRQLGEIRVLVSDMHSAMLNLRRNEKDFLARKDMRYQQKFVHNFNQLQADLTKLRSGLKENGVETTKADRLDEILATYSQRFLHMADLQKAIGLHHEDGYYGQMREAIHQVEDILQMLRQNLLLKDMLMLRRHEKDFMLRRDEKYVERFDADMAAMRSDLSKIYLDNGARRFIIAGLSAYETTFKELATAMRTMGFTSDDGLHGEMRRSIHQGERLLLELRQDLLLRESSAGGSMINQIIAFAVVLTLLMAALMRV